MVFKNRNGFKRFRLDPKMEFENLELELDSGYYTEWDPRFWNPRWTWVLDPKMDLDLKSEIQSRIGF